MKFSDEVRYECLKHGFLGTIKTRFIQHIIEVDGIHIGAKTGTPKYWCRGNLDGEPHQEIQYFKDLPSLLNHLKDGHDVGIIVEKGLSKKRVFGV